MAQHETTIYGFDGHNGMEELANAVGDLRYDALSQFLGELTAKLARDAAADAVRSRPQLSGNLREAARGVHEAHLATQQAWKICKPYMS